MKIPSFPLDLDQIQNGTQNIFKNIGNFCKESADGFVIRFVSTVIFLQGEHTVFVGVKLGRESACCFLQCQGANAVRTELCKLATVGHAHGDAVHVARVAAGVFMAEESAAMAEPQGTCWIIDPVDGTTNFAHRFADTATSVALWEHGRVVFGAVSAPMRGERYAAEQGRGAWLNGRRLSVSAVDSCAEALAATGFPYSVRKDMDAVLRDLRILLGSTIGVRRCGSAALDLCFVASGSFDAYFEGWIKPWDVAAGWLLVEEAGGRVSGRDGRPYRFHTPILASNGHIHEELVTLLRLDS